MYDFLLAVHILCAVIWVGGGATLHVLARRARKQGGDAILAYTRESAWLGPRMYAPLAIILLVAGILLVGEVGYEHSDLFITLGYLGWLTSVFIGIVVYPRLERRVFAAAEAHGADSPELRAAFGRYGNVNTFELAVLLAIVVDMAVKPGL